MIMQRCTKCILPESYPGIIYNNKGICNYCTNYKKMNFKGEKKLLNIISNFRTKKEDKCIVALSGGRDSTYVAHYAVNKLKLNVLAVTFDHGFMPRQTIKNIKTTVKKLKINHYVLKNINMKNHVKHFMSAFINCPSPSMIALLCTGCTTGIMQSLIKSGNKNKISFILGGGGVVGRGGEPERSFAEKLFKLPGNFRMKKLSIVIGFARNFLKNPYYILNPSFLVALLKEFYYRYIYKLDNQIQTLGLFEFIPWNEKEICSIIENKLNWQKPKHIQTSWRSDCKIHFLKQYLYRETLGFTKNDELLSGMIRENMITREEALKRLEHDNIISKKHLADFLNELGIEIQELDIALDNYRKNLN